MTSRLRKTLHPLTGAPLAPVELVTKRGERRLIWPILGGAEDDGDGEGDGEGDGTGGDAAGDGGDEDATGDLGDKGKKALDAMKGERNAARRDLRPWAGLAQKFGVKTPAELEALLEGKKPEGKDTPDPDKIRREAESAATQKANERIVRAEVKAAAGGKLADPADAVRLLDLSQFELDSDGEVDEDEIAEAIEDLLKKKPYLAAQGGKTDEKRKPKGDRSQGARGGSGPLSGREAGLAEAQKRFPKKVTTSS